ncbi:DNA polymerase III subunit epsilon [Roseospira goensis]|uniref:DNA polymerase III subunit epsilon n=1 Tax=Roseospira goensis TaxID=391922 RepID=A0A7W6S1Q5_9PROT|nr:DNA polymerase III subunit epsilon [Roseospira goensis]MBB4287301.1 DNA polymerase-3 subunit epsilon [Roseospira goensis]
MTREVVLDTETTGMNPLQGDRIVEIGALELLNHMPTGRTYHVYLNPDRDMPDGAFRVHGLSAEFLADKPRFHDIADEFLAFVAEATLVIHNADFDMGFLNAELGRIGRDPLPMERAVDTVRMARRKYPGAPASLDALCRRFGIDNAHRTLHGALLDSELLAEVYLQLIGGREPGFRLVGDAGGAGAADDAGAVPVARPDRAPRPHAATAAELEAHAAFLARLKDPIWTRGEA